MTSPPDPVLPSLPRAGGWPLLGALPGLLARPFPFLDEARRRHGDVYTLPLGPTSAIVLNHPRHAQHVLRDRASNYRKGGAMWDAIRTVMGNGLFVSEGEFWLRQRRMMQPQFHRQRLAGLAALMVRAIDDSLARWQDGDTEVLAAFNHLTMSVVTATLFGAALAPEAAAAVAGSMAYVLDYLLVGAATRRLPAWLPVPGQRRFRRELAQFDRAVYDIIRAARRGESSGDHLLAMLLDVVDDETGERMNDDQLHDEVANLFLAGYESTSLVLTWTVHYLTTHPEVMQRLRGEVDQVLGGRTPGFADLPQLPYTRMVLQEVMRLRPPAYWVPRVAVEADTIDGHPIAPGTLVVVLTYMLHRHPDFWPDPERFDPERFSQPPRHPFAWVPFGAGQRLCIGREFAMIEGSLALAMTLQRFDLSAVPGRTAELGLSLTLRPKAGAWARVRARPRG